MNFEKSYVVVLFWDFLFEKIIINSVDSKVLYVFIVKGSKEMEFERVVVGREDRGCFVFWISVFYEEKDIVK